MTDTFPVTRLQCIRIEGFKSIREAEIKLGALNVLIGENGSGKSNFVEVFRLLRAVADETLRKYVTERGASNLLHLGSEETKRIVVQVSMPPLGYDAFLLATDEGSLAILDFLNFEESDDLRGRSVTLQQSPESRLRRDKGLFSGGVREALDSWVVYHFHDTSPNAKCRGFAPLHDWDRLRAEGENLAAYLFRLKNGDPEDQRAYARIERLVGLGLPFFDRFVLESTPGRSPGNEDALLRWRQKGSDFPFTAQHLSDGSLRYVLLTTALNQPVDHRPTTMVIDEPELGLHPSMLALLALLAGQIKSVAATGQAIVATQSPALLDEFEPEDIIVVERQGAESTFRRLPMDQLQVWLEEYSLSDVVRKNLIGGLR